MISDYLHNTFSQIRKFNLDSLADKNVTYIGAVGFEERSIKILELI